MFVMDTQHAYILTTLTTVKANTLLLKISYLTFDQATIEIK